MFSNHFQFSKILVKHIILEILDSIWNCVLEFPFNLILYFFPWNQNLNTTTSTFLVKHLDFWNRTKVGSLRSRTSDNNGTTSGLNDVLTSRCFHLQRKSTLAVSTMRFKNTSSRSTDTGSGLALMSLKPLSPACAQNGHTRQRIDVESWSIPLKMRKDVHIRLKDYSEILDLSFCVGDIIMSAGLCLFALLH